MAKPNEGSKPDFLNLGKRKLGCLHVQSFSSGRVFQSSAPAQCLERNLPRGTPALSRPRPDGRRVSPQGPPTDSALCRPGPARPLAVPSAGELTPASERRRSALWRAAGAGWGAGAAGIRGAPRGAHKGWDCAAPPLRAPLSGRATSEPQRRS